MSEQSNSSYEDLDAIEATSEEGRILNNLFSRKDQHKRSRYKNKMEIKVLIIVSTVMKLTKFKVYNVLVMW